MNISPQLIIGVLSAALFAAGCGRQETPVEKAVDSTKDALDVREHEKLKDAAEETKEAVDDAVEGIKDEPEGK